LVLSFIDDHSSDKSGAENIEEGAAKGKTSAKAANKNAAA
jgi:hypothetical protein